jgi:sulfate adenylyltransferase large subunit
MTTHLPVPANSEPAPFALEPFLDEQQNKSLLRFIACGSVDHGKSTLIGRLLYESGQLFDDQLSTLKADTVRYSKGEDLDFSLLLDGLAAEREQKITIDVAYRFFSTQKRKFIVIDAPGHEQYTPNMATGASNADVALLLVSADSGLTRQTKRHGVIVSMLRVRELVVAVNKMDAVDWSQERFAQIERDFRAFAGTLDVDRITFIPMSARSGDNVITQSDRMPWYRGPALLSYLEDVEVRPQNAGALRMPIQWVNRPDAHFRGYCGLMSSGEARVGMEVRIAPSGQRTHIASIVVGNGTVARAVAGQSVTLTFDDEIDASRGDVVVDAAQPLAASDRFTARVFWMGQQPLVAGRSYVVKLGTATASAVALPAIRRLDLDTQAEAPATALSTNDIGHCELRLDRPLGIERYAANRETGSFILIDPESFDTVALGTVLETSAAREASDGHAPAKDAVQAEPKKTRLASFFRASESHSRSVLKAISWRTTGSVDTFLVTWFITGSTAFAGGVAATEILTKIVLYYFHERIWALIPWGQKRAEAADVTKAAVKNAPL